MAYGVTSTTHYPGPPQVQMLTYTHSLTGAFGTSTYGHTSGYTADRYSMTSSSSYASQRTATDTADTDTTRYTSSQEGSSCGSRTYVSNRTTTSGASAETTRATSLYSIAVQATTTETRTYEVPGTGTRLGWETYIDVSTDGTFESGREITVTDLWSVTTATRTIFRTTNTATIAETSVHQVPLTYPAPGEALYKRVTAAISDPLYKLVNSTITQAIDRAEPFTVYRTATETRTVRGTQTATALSEFTQTTTFAELATFPTTITVQQQTTAGGLSTTVTATSQFRSVSAGASLAMTTNVSGVTTTSYTHAGGTDRISTRTENSISFLQSVLRTISTTVPTMLLPTNGNTVHFGETLATALTTYPFESRPSGWTYPVFTTEFFGNGTPAATFLATFTHVITATTLNWALAIPAFTEGSFVVTNHGDGAIAPEESMMYTDAGMGLIGIPAGYDAIRFMFGTNAVFCEGLPILTPVSLRFKTLWDASTTFKAATSLNSVSVTRISSTSTNTTSFVWTPALSSVSTRYDSGDSHGVYSVDPVTGFERGAVAYTSWNGSVSTAEKRTGLGSFTATAQQIIASRIPVMLKASDSEGWGYYFSGPNNEKSA